MHDLIEKLREAFDPNNLEDYQGGRDLKALKAFARESLGPTVVLPVWTCATTTRRLR